MVPRRAADCHDCRPDDTADFPEGMNECSAAMRSPETRPRRRHARELAGASIAQPSPMKTVEPLPEARRRSNARQHADVSQTCARASAPAGIARPTCRVGCRHDNTAPIRPRDPDPPAARVRLPRLGDVGRSPGRRREDGGDRSPRLSTRMASRCCPPTTRSPAPADQHEAGIQDRARRAGHGADRRRRVARASVRSTR